MWQGGKQSGVHSQVCQQIDVLNNIWIRMGWVKKRTLGERAQGPTWEEAVKTDGEMPIFWSFAGVLHRRSGADPRPPIFGDDAEEPRVLGEPVL
jgi:hypothetical protein